MQIYVGHPQGGASTKVKNPVWKLKIPRLESRFETSRQRYLWAMAGNISNCNLAVIITANGCTSDT